MQTNPIQSFEEKFGVRLPNSYKNFILQKGSAIIDGYRVVGLPIKDVFLDAEKATNLLRYRRPDLPLDLVAVIVAQKFVCCLDIAKSTQEDGPLVEVDLENINPPKPLGKTFSEWISYHEKMEKRFRRGCARVRNRQKEAEQSKSKIRSWSTPIFRVKDYIIGIGAFRFSYRLGCLEVDEFLPINQPHVKKGEAVKVLFSEAMIRARDYSGALNLQFIKDAREDENGEIDSSLPPKRVIAPIPEEIMDLAECHSIKLSNPKKGFICHEDALNLWFASLELPAEVGKRIIDLEEAGYLTKEIITEIITLGIWSKDEVIWVFVNAPRPEALILGSDPVEDRFSFIESLNYGRVALMATRLKFAVLAEMNEGFKLEEIEEIKTNCTVEPKNEFWLLWCNDKFHFPTLWLADRNPDLWFKDREPVLLLCRPHIPASKEYELERLKSYLEILVNAKEPVQAKCLVLSNEYISPYYCKFVDEVKDFVKKAQEKGVQVIFTPTRIDLYLDQEIQSRMYKIKKIAKFPCRPGPIKLQIIEVPKEQWRVPDGSKESRAIQNAFLSALNFAQQLTKKREVRRYGMEFALMCEVIEREASQNYKVIAELDSEKSLAVLKALKREDESLRGVSFSFVAPDDMPSFIQRLKDEAVVSIFYGVQGGIVAMVKLWEYPYIPPEKIDKKHRRASLKLPLKVQEEMDKQIKADISGKKYASHWIEIERGHALVRESLGKGIPLAIASIRGRIRANVFAEVIRDYIYALPETSLIKMPIAYGDGSQGDPFPLFSLPAIDMPNNENFFTYCVGLVSLRHPEADVFLDRILVRNRDIQNKLNTADQEELAYKKTYECLDELLKFIQGGINEKDDLSPSLKILLGWKPDFKKQSWQGINLHVFHTTGLEAAGIGAYLAIVELLQKYRGKMIVTPRILISDDHYKEGKEWF
ncbi:hypothetical protein CVT91_03365 [Candidatus Atribacteria bacterium HGW-Atribacteria-1]|nr:MAG: hypothetical protein CVT91_03365 [Candidatus Atribacteria bacterium HGW-Atribacteria-1]